MTDLTERAVTDKIIQSLATYLKRDPATITESHHLRDDLGLDSVAIIELLFEIEERFKLQIPDQDLPGLSTVGSVAAYVKRRLDEPAPAAEKPAHTPAKAASAKAPSLKKTSSKKAASAKPAPSKPAASKKPKKTAPTSTKKKGTAR